MISLSCLSDSKSSETVPFRVQTKAKNNITFYIHVVYTSLDNLWRCRQSLVDFGNDPVAVKVAMSDITVQIMMTAR
jgi:hypothetical protein